MAKKKEEIAEQTVEEADITPDFDDIDLSDISEDDLSDLDLSGFGEVDDTVDYPHFKISTKAFKEFLKVAKIVCSAGGRDVVSKAVCFSVENGVLVCRSTDFDVYIEEKLELLNEENILTEPVIVSTDILIRLAKAVPVNTTIFKNDDTFFIRLYGGDFVLETYSMSVDKFKFTDEVENKGQVQAEELYSVIKDFSPVVTAAVAPQERRIVCSDKEAIASYMWAILKFNSGFQDFDLKIKDISVLKNLLVASEEILQVSFTKGEDAIKRCVLEGSAFKYAFLISDAKVSESMKDNLNKVITGKGVYVDFIQLFKVIEVAADLPYSVGKVGMNFCDEGLKVVIKTKKNKDAEFNITASVEGDATPLDEELVVQAKLLKIVLRSFASKPSILISLSKEGMGVSADDYSSAIYSETK